MKGRYTLAVLFWSLSFIWTKGALDYLTDLQNFPGDFWCTAAFGGGRDFDDLYGYCLAIYRYEKGLNLMI